MEKYINAPGIHLATNTKWRSFSDCLVELSLYEYDRLAWKLGAPAPVVSVERDAFIIRVDEDITMEGNAHA